MEDPAFWNALDPTLLAQAEQRPNRVPNLLACLRDGSYAYFSELTQTEQLSASRELRALAESVGQQTVDRALGSIYLQRVVRLAVTGLVVLGIAALGIALKPRARKPGDDLAFDMPWRASSLLPDTGCDSPLQQCSASPNLFFHTPKQRDPWLELDLGDNVQFSTVQLENRTDCCADRAVPLTVAVSADRIKWSTVATRETDFSTWRATFKPVHARWVKLTVHKQTFFHLSRVMVLP